MSLPLLCILLLVPGINQVCQGSDYCMSDCNIQGQRAASQYELMCCDPVNMGRYIQFQEDHRIRYISCPSSIPDWCSYYMRSCSDILITNLDATSGYYNHIITNGSTISVYCDMEGSNCGGEGGWTRIAFINMSEPGTTCPTGLTEEQYDNITLCGLNHTALTNTYDPVCNSTFFSTYGLNYSKVCGQVRGYQYGFAEGFDRNHDYGYSLSDPYLTGVSITYDDNPLKHIWSYVCGLSELDYYYEYQNCPCNIGNYLSPHFFIDNDYYCESGFSDPYAPHGNLFSSNDPLWDGQQCNTYESTCCTTPNMPWFIKTLNETVSDDIQLRVCGGDYDYYYGEKFSTPLDVIELYVK